MSILDDIEASAPAPQPKWHHKLAAKDPEFVAEIRLLIRGWWAGTRATKYRSKNALAKFIRDYDGNKVGVEVQAITDLIDELKETT
jgi:hypothetical protein